MDRQQAYDFLRAMFPCCSVCLSDELWFHTGNKEEPPWYSVSVHNICKNSNGGIASGRGKSWEEAIKKMFKSLFSYGEK